MKYNGNPVSPGVALGSAYIYSAFCPSAAESYFDEGELETQQDRYEQCRERAHQELLNIQEKLKSEPEKAKIFAAHVDILYDEAMDEDIDMLISEELASPDWAIQTVYDRYIKLLSANPNPLIAERAADLRDVQLRLLRCWEGGEERNLSALESPVVVVAHDLAPSDTATLDREKVLAIVTEVGGSTSHSAIIARSYGIPALLGVEDATKNIAHGALLIVDAINGSVTVSPDAAEQAAALDAIEIYKRKREDTLKYLYKTPITPDHRRVEVELNIASAAPGELSDVGFADGVGLFRTEFLYMGHDRLPTEEEQYQVYKRVLLTFGERPVILRTLDIGGDKKLECLKLPKEDNPFLGKRALRLCLDNMPVFETQLRAALRAGVYGKLWIMFPMVGSMDDIRAARAVVERVCRELDAEGAEYSRDFKLGIMIEIPSIALLADQAAKEVDFASIGTNDLTQYTMAADRMNPTVAKYYQTFNPAVFRLIRNVAREFTAAGKPLSVCGEMGGNPLTAAVLLGFGISRLSMGATSVPGVKKLICGLTAEKAEKLAEEVCACATAEEAESKLREELKELL